MRAAVVRQIGSPPEYSEFPDPQPIAGESIVRVAAAAVQPITLARAAGAHYSSDTKPPFVAGIDGVGTTPDGRRVYFHSPRPPFGGLAEQVPVAAVRSAPVPDAIDDVTAAAVAVPAMSCWLPLTRVAPVRPGMAILVNGATGGSGRVAVQLAKHLGAGTVVATGRSPEKLAQLRTLGADEVVPIGSDPAAFRAAIRELARRHAIRTVIDYLWGASAEAILGALGGPDAPSGPERVWFVHVGGVTGPTISLPGAILRSSGVAIVGSGLGSAPFEDFLGGLGPFFEAYLAGGFRQETEVHPLAEVGARWGRTGEDRRLVFRVG